MNKPIVDTIKEAVRLSIIKWEWVVKNKGKSYYYDKNNELIEPEDEFPILYELNHECGLCEFQLQQHSGFKTYSDYCKPCPLYKVNGCGKTGSDWSKWHKEDKDDGDPLPHAKEILRKIKEIKI